ncbi:MAG: hypothetical protein AABZ33_02780 [Chloroflexota bacterium]
MFGTLLGPLPRPQPAIDHTGDGGGGRDRVRSVDDLVREAIRAQEQAGLEPITDGGLRLADPFDVVSPNDAGESAVDDWRFAAGCTEVMVKQALPGPYTLGRRLADGGVADGRDAASDRNAASNHAARVVNGRIHDLIDAGCPYIEIHEPDATLIGEDPAERRRFKAAQAVLVEGVHGAHLSLVITGGNADAAGPETILVDGYQSLAVDLIAGPDNWRLIARATESWGIVCGALRTTEGSDDGPELLVWATRYAASTGGRGLVRVGLGTAGGLAALSWTAALTKMERLGRAAYIAGLPPGDELASSLDPRALDLKSRAFGRRVPRRTLSLTDRPAKEDE